MIKFSNLIQVNKHLLKYSSTFYFITNYAFNHLAPYSAQNRNRQAHAAALELPSHVWLSTPRGL